MSTRSQIGIYPEIESKEYEILLYKHCDGYPEGILPTLEPIIKRIKKERGFDPEYTAAWVLYEFMDEHVKGNIERHKEYKSIPADGKDFISFGICGNLQLHGDIDYFYGVFPDRIEVNEMLNDDKMKLLTTISI